MGIKESLVTELLEKEQILKKAGYSYDPDREAYVNRKARKLFSIDYLEDHDTKVIARKIQETTHGAKWTFIFNNEPSDSVKRELAKLLDA
jgi:hypothetical protein